MILAVIEHDRGELEVTCLQMLAFARNLAKKMDVPLEAALIGDDANPLVEKTKRYGMVTLHRIRHKRLTDYAPKAWASTIIQLSRERGAQAVLCPGTDRGNEILAHVAAQTGLPMAANCSEVKPGEVYSVVRLRWGSSLLERAELSCEIKLITVAPHIIEATEAPGTIAEILDVTPILQDCDFQIRVVRREETTTTGATLKTARLVVGGGRGVGSADAFAVLEDLANTLGGVVGGSRVATNNGWRPHSDQVGLTGNRIAPQLYIACGISGAIQHLVGCKGAEKILVINSDREAPFFARADYGVVGDLHEVVPAIVAEIAKERRKPSP